MVSDIRARVDGSLADDDQQLQAAGAGGLQLPARGKDDIAEKLADSAGGRPAVAVGDKIAQPALHLNRIAGGRAVAVQRGCKPEHIVDGVPLVFRGKALVPGAATGEQRRQGPPR